MSSMSLASLIHWEERRAVRKGGWKEREEGRREGGGKEFYTYLLCFIKLLIMDVQEGMVEGIVHGTLRNTTSILLHPVPFP